VSPTAHLDPAAVQVLDLTADGVAVRWAPVLQRVAFSPYIKERADCSAALL
jgi:N-methylhydantoinase B/oxoprolinase/acetone carboxylase alpha subunit